MHSISDFWYKFQFSLIPYLEDYSHTPISKKLEQFLWTVDVVDIDMHISSPYLQKMGRTRADRRNLARAFVAKSVYDMPTTTLLVEHLKNEPNLRRFCGFERLKDIPSQATFSRAFAEFAKLNLGDKVLKALVKEYVGDKVVMHVSRDSTAVHAREKPAKKIKPEPKSPKKRGRPKKGDPSPPKKITCIEKQLKQTPEEALAELSRVCDAGCKQDSKGNKNYWIGYKAHLDWADGGFPLQMVTTSASVHDSQAAIPMERITARYVTSLYSLADSAYDAPAIHQACTELGHVAIIDANKRRGDAEPMEKDRKRRYNERATAERGNSSLKDQYGFSHLRVRGHTKVHMHLMFGVLALFADRLHHVFKT